MLLYTCGQKKRGAWLGHPCGKAARALDQAGYEYEVKVVGGYRFLPWDKPRRDEDRVEVRRLSGANEVPILVFEDGEVIAGSAIIARWAGEHPAASAARSEV